MRKDYISVSSIEQYCQCGEAWRLKDEGIDEPETPDTIRGSAVHHAVAANMRRKRDDGQAMPYEEAGQIAFDRALALFRSRPVALEPESAARGLKVVSGEIADMALALSSLHHSRVAPFIQPVGIEQRIRVKVPGLPDMLGILDLTDTDKIVHDTKTKTRQPNADEAAKSIQLSQYELIYRAHYGEAPSGLRLDHLVHYSPSKKNPEGRVEYVRQDTQRTKEQLQSYLDRVDTVTKAMKAGIAVPAPTASWKCSPKYCGYYGTECKFTKGML